MANNKYICTLSSGIIGTDARALPKNTPIFKSLFFVNINANCKKGSIE